MRESAKEFPWANIWMMAFSAAGVWLVYPRGEHPYWLNTAQAIVPLAIIFLIGFIRMPPSLYYEDSGGRLTMNDMARLYLDALKQVFRQRWILWLFGSLLALTLIAMFADLALQSPRPADPYPMPTERPDFMVTFSRSVHTSITSAPNRFLPSFGATNAALGIATVGLALIVFVIYLGVYSKRLADDPEYSRQAEFLRFLAAPTVILLAAVVVASPIAWARYIADLARARAGDFGPTHQGTLIQVMTYGGALTLLVLTSVVVSGVLGSLRRAGHGKAVTRDTFVRSVVRYLPTMAGVYLILVVAGAVLLQLLIRLGDVTPLLAEVVQVTQWLMLLLAFAPYAVVACDRGVVHAITGSVRDWVSNVGEVLPFVALGITLISVPGILCEIPTILLRSYPGESALRSALGYLNVGVDRAIVLLVTAVMMVAVWEFYQGIVRAEQSPRP